MWEGGVLNARERVFATEADRLIRPFEYVLTNFDTRNATPGGALFQALVFGYFRADSPSLTLESHSVNTGSSHADMIGDVAGYRGGEVELAVEVKDHQIDENSVEAVLTDFLEDIVRAPNVTAVVVASSVTEGARSRLEGVNVIALTRAELSRRVVTWDLPKQQEALRGAAYYLSRIQKSQKLLLALTDFVNEHELDAGFVRVSSGPRANLAPSSKM